MEKSELELAGCLRRLLRSRYIIRSRNETWFKMIVDHRKQLQEVVHTFGAQLNINEPLGVIHLSAENEELEDRLALRMSRPKILSAFSTALILHLRWHRLQFYLQPSASDVPVVDALEMRDYLYQFSKAKVDAQFERQFRRCIEELSELQVIVETASDSGFYEITALCDLLLPADQIKELKSRAEVYFSHATETMEQDNDAG